MQVNQGGQTTPGRAQSLDQRQVAVQRQNDPSTAQSHTDIFSHQCPTRCGQEQHRAGFGKHPIASSRKYGSALGLRRRRLIWSDRLYPHDSRVLRVSTVCQGPIARLIMERPLLGTRMECFCRTTAHVWTRSRCTHEQPSGSNKFMDLQLRLF